MNKWIAKNYSSEDIRVSNFFNKNVLKIPLGGDFDCTYVVIEKLYHDENQPESMSNIELNFKNQYGMFSLGNAEQVIKALTAVSFKKGLGFANFDQIAFMCKKFPVGLSDALGGIFPCNENMVLGNPYRALLKVESHDVGLACEIRADYGFWINLVGSVDQTFCISADSNRNVDSDSFVRFPIKIGESNIRSGDLDQLEIGDALLLSTQLIDSEGYGSLAIGQSVYRYQMYMKNGSVCLKIIEVQAA